jgi:colicin import membrane protein
VAIDKEMAAAIASMPKRKREAMLARIAKREKSPAGVAAKKWDEDAVAAVKANPEKYAGSDSEVAQRSRVESGWKSKHEGFKGALPGKPEGSDHGAKFKEHMDLAKKYEDAGEDAKSKAHSQAAHEHDTAERAATYAKAYPDNKKLQREADASSKKANEASDSAGGKDDAPAGGSAISEQRDKDDATAVQQGESSLKAGERKEKEAKSTETGSRGGQFYVNSAGNKVYVKK